jgi:hypothetical protein
MARKEALGERLRKRFATFAVGSRADALFPEPIRHAR